MDLMEDFRSIPHCCDKYLTWEMWCWTSADYKLLKKIDANLVKYSGCLCN